MINITEFHYSNVKQRKLIYLNAILITLIATFIIFDSLNVLKYYFTYNLVFQKISIIVLIGLFIGNIIGKILFSAFGNKRSLIIVIDSIIVLFFVCFCLRNIFNTNGPDALLIIYNYSLKLLVFLLLAFIIFIASKIHYLLKVACGDFIDEKQAIVPLTIWMIIGFIFGIAVTVIKPYLGSTYYYCMLIFSLSEIVPFFIHLPYAPQPLYAQNYGAKKEQVDETDITYKDSLVFSYLNFTFIVVYSFLSYQVILKFVNSILAIKIFFLLIVALSIVVGMLFASLLRFSYNHVLNEVLYPIFFFPILIVLYMFLDSLDTYMVFSVLSLLFVLFGFSLRNTLKNIMTVYNYKQRFRILDFAFLIIPVPVIISLGYINFTSRWFFIIVYISAFMNILLPGIYIINSNLSKIKKTLYFIFLLLFIPLVIVVNLGLEIPMDNNLFKKKISGFDQLKQVNYNSVIIKNDFLLTYKKSPIFRVSDSIIRNYKKAAVFSQIFNTDQQSQFLIIDGNQRFFRNPVFGEMKKLVCLDYLSDRIVDYQRLPFSGKQLYAPAKNYLLNYLKYNINIYDIIIDVPNLYDQTIDSYRFTEGYYKQVKGHLRKGGIFISYYNMPDCSIANLKKSVTGLKSVYSYNNVYLFSNILVVVSSDDQNALLFDDQKYLSTKQVLQDNIFDEKYFYSEMHIMSKLVYTSLDPFLSLIDFKEKSGKNLDFDEKHEDSREVYVKLVDVYKNDNSKVLDNLNKRQLDEKTIKIIEKDLEKNRQILYLLKMTELTEAFEQFTEETQYLFELKRMMEYNIPLKEYLSAVLKYKEDYYYNAARRFEDEKQWDKAKKLYKAILFINKNNFYANYNLGLLSLTLQEMDNAFIYLQNAMKLNNQHPKVLYQMGVLHYSRGEINEAINYFNAALNQKEKFASIYFYLGMCYEELKKYDEADYYFKKALIEDPNNSNIITRYENNKKKIDEEKEKWKQNARKNQMDAEQGEEILLPVNKSAYDVRLKDKDDAGNKAAP